MYICRNCGQRFSTRTSFCNNCGSSMIEPTASESYGYSYGSSDIYVSPAPSGGKPQAIVGMILGIESICGAILSLIYAFITLGIAETYSSSYYYSYYNYSDEVYAFGGITIVCSIFHVVLGIVALVLGCVARGKGSRSGMAGAGKALGIVSTIISAVSFLLTVSTLASV